ncbi:AMIN domain-containing protein [Scytonema sp. NUACC26]|uniref:AMIN domain-containing protein n=1 Tax=Scytonema sp. NUACC26 TaxID=3140176 RepID=UPI0034DCA354
MDKYFCQFVSIASSVMLLTAQPLKAQEIAVTQVRLQKTDSGIELILQTPKPELLRVNSKTDGNTYIADIPNAQLRLSSGSVFRQENPVSGISAIAVTNQDANSIRVTAIGEASVPKIELFDSDEGLILGITSATSSAQNPTTSPSQADTAPTQNPTPNLSQSTETQPSTPSPEAGEPIELLVTGEQDGYIIPSASTATKTDTSLRDIPQSIQVIPRQVLEDQKVTRLRDVLQNVSGITLDGNYGGTGSGSLIIRGFSQDTIFKDGFRN